MGGRSRYVGALNTGPVTIEYFEDNVGEAVKWLNYIEEMHPNRRREALLLVGVVEHEATERLIQTTHPLYTGIRVLDPKYWKPKEFLI